MEAVSGIITPQPSPMRKPTGHSATAGTAQPTVHQLSMEANGSAADASEMATLRPESDEAAAHVARLAAPLDAQPHSLEPPVVESRPKAQQVIASAPVRAAYAYSGFNARAPELPAALSRSQLVWVRGKPEPRPAQDPGLLPLATPLELLVSAGLGSASSTSARIPPLPVSLASPKSGTATGSSTAVPVALQPEPSSVSSFSA